jgi:8-oxo-dGTP diphosphatase
MIKKFHVGIKAVILQKNKALVLKELDVRDNTTSLYDLPGGRIEDNESIEEALKRELKEEINVSNFILGPIIYAQRHPYLNINGASRMLLYYEVDIKNAKIKLSEEHTSFQWISKKDLAEIIKNKDKMHSGIRTVLEKVLK